MKTDDVNSGPGLATEAAVTRLRRQARDLAARAAVEGSRDGRLYVLKSADYQTVMRLVEFWEGDQCSGGDLAECLWCLLDSDGEAYVTWLAERQLPAAPYAEAFIDAAVEAWGEIQDEVEA